jgi:hypothetical protein
MVSPQPRVGRLTFPLSTFCASHYVSAKAGKVTRPRYGGTVGACEKSGHPEGTAQLILKSLHLIEVEHVFEFHGAGVIHRLREGGNAILELLPDLPAVRLQSFQSLDLLFQGGYFIDQLLIRCGGIFHWSSWR